MQKDYLERVYAGFLGMNIGIRLGAPVEPTIWTYERIRDTYGDITDYVKEYKNFAADDDVNGPVYFFRALRDDAADRELKPQDVANAWLNYAREGVGMFWWGGYGVSTEHTAYLNLKNGIPAPQSGSIRQNGKILAEQIGGQIFIDTWGLCWPGNPKMAAKFGEAAASVSHDGEGIYGARFFCACIAEAFVSDDIEQIIETGLRYIPDSSAYGAVVRGVREFFHQYPDDFRLCHEYLVKNWGYDKYKGTCHIIPNAGVCALAMFYGKGDFARTVEIATMCGWDTDCNAGNVGTVLGVMCGINKIPEHYRKPINDGIVLSGISGYLNILDIPSYAKEIAAWGYKLSGEEAPEIVKESIRDGEIHFDFELPGSTHNIRLSDPFFCRAEHSEEQAYKGTGSLKILVDRMVRGDQCKVYYKPFYKRDAFSDERYSPVFAPTVYSGQTVSMELYLDQWNGWERPGAAPYIRTAADKKEHLQGYVQLKQGEWTEVSFQIPDTKGDLIDEVGIVIEGYSPSKTKTLGAIYLDEFSVRGNSRYSIAIEKQRKEFGAVTPFSMNHGAWEIEDGKLSCMRCGEAFAYSGNYYEKNYCVKTTVEPVNGESHLLAVRALGAMRGYGAGFSEMGKAAIYKNDFGYKKIAETDFPWEIGTVYEMKVKVQEKELILFIDGKEVLRAEDDQYSHGMYGCGSLTMGRTRFGDFWVETTD